MEFLKKKEKEFFLWVQKKFNINDPEKTHYDPNKPDLFNKNLKPYETVGKHIKEFDQDLYEEEHEKTNLGTYYKELKKVKPGENYLALCDGKKSNFKKIRDFGIFIKVKKEDLPSWTIAAQPGPWVGPFTGAIEDLEFLK